MSTFNYSMAAVAKNYVDIFSTLYKPHPKDSINLRHFERDLNAEASSTPAVMATSGSMAAWGVWYQAKKMKEGRNLEFYDAVKECVKKFDKEPIAIKKEVIKQLIVKLGPEAENLWRRRLRKYISLPPRQNVLAPSAVAGVSAIFKRYLYPVDQSSATIPKPADDARCPVNTIVASPEHQPALSLIRIPDAMNGHDIQMSSGGPVDVPASTDSVHPWTLVEPSSLNRTYWFQYAHPPHVKSNLPNLLACSVAQRSNPLLPAMKVAGITMKFEDANSPGCQMFIEISAAYAPMFARAFVDGEISQCGALRCILLDVGPTIIPDPSVELRGRQPEVLKKLLGPLLFTGNTDHVHMFMSCIPEENVTLCVSLDMSRGIELCKTLYDLV